MNMLAIVLEQFFFYLFIFSIQIEIFDCCHEPIHIEILKYMYNQYHKENIRVFWANTLLYSY